MSLTVKSITSFDLTVKINCAAANGQFIGKAKIKTKPENKALFEKVEAGEIEDDAELIRDLFEGFEGLPCEKGQEFQYVTEGPISAYLVPALIQAYFQQYAEARQGNSKARRGR